MAVLTQSELGVLFFRATMRCLGLDPDSADQCVQRRVRISWPLSEAGNSDWQREENVVFLRITPEQDVYDDLRDVTHRYDADTDQLFEVVTYHRSYSVLFVCYGPDAVDEADRVRIGLHSEDVKALLARQNVAFLPHIHEPVMMMEQDSAGQWWNRCDLTAKCYALSSREYAVGQIAHVPVEAKADTGGIRLITA